MPKVASKRTALEFTIPLACADEAAAVAFLEAQRWGNTPNCPRCGDVEVTQMKAKDGSRNVRFLWRCQGCKQQYTVRVGTIMEDSPIPLRHWCLAVYRAAASKKGVSALQIQRETDLSYKSALYLMHRIRWAMAPANENEPMLGTDGGTVEF
jgi:transposase-like protein